MSKDNADKVSSEAALNFRAEKLQKRKEKLDLIEAEIEAREREIAAKEAKRKQIVLRIPESLWREIARWA